MGGGEGGRGEGNVVVHDGSLGITGGLESSNNGAAGGDVDGRDGETLLAGIGK
jgi:hypothetical protein